MTATTPTADPAPPPAPDAAATDPAEAAPPRSGAGWWQSRAVAAFIDLVPALVVVTDAELVTVAANRVAVQRGFSPPDQLMGRRFSEAMPPDLAAANLPYARAALGGQPQRFQRTSVDAYGMVRHSQVSYVPYRGQDGIVQGLVILAVDVSDRVLAEAALRRQAEEAAVHRERMLLAAAAQERITRPLFAATLELSASLAGGGHDGQQRVAEAIGSIDTAIGDLRRMILRPGPAPDSEPARGSEPRLDVASQAVTAELVATNVSDLVTITDAARRYVWASPSALSVTGWLPEQLLGLDLLAFVHPEDQELVRSRLASVPEGARSASAEYRYRRPDGSYQWVEDISRAFGGDGAGRITTTRDVSERRRREATLAGTAELLELGFREAPIGMAHLAPDGRWIKVNPALARITGLTEQQLLAARLQDIAHPDHLDDLDLLEEVRCGQRDGYQVDRTYVRADGTTVRVQLSVTAVRDAAGSLRFLVAQLLEREAQLAPH